MVTSEPYVRVGRTTLFQRAIAAMVLFEDCKTLAFRHATLKGIRRRIEVICLEKAGPFPKVTPRYLYSSTSLMVLGGISDSLGMTHRDIISEPGRRRRIFDFLKFIVS